MTPKIRMPDGCGSDGAAYVLGALEPDEAEAYVRHLSRCAACRDEVAVFQRLADALPMAAPQYRLPARLRRRVLRTVRAEARRRNHRRRNHRHQNHRHQNHRHQNHRHQNHRHQSHGRRRLALAAVAVAALLIAVAFVVTSAPGGPKLLRATVVSSTGTAQLRIDGARGDLLVQHLPAPATGRIYEVWLKRPNAAPAPTSALFGVTAGGAADIGVPGTLRGVSEILVTEEPAGGSSVPTGPPVIVAPTS